MRALRSEEVEVGGEQFEITELPYFAALRLFTKLTRLLGAQILTILITAGGSGMRGALAVAQSMTPAELAEMLASCFGRLTPEVVEDLMLDILQTTKVHQGEQLVPLVGGKSKKGVMDAVVGGDFWGGIVLAGQALRVLYWDFSSARGVFGNRGPTTGDADSSESTTSTGGRGGS